MFHRLVRSFALVLVAIVSMVSAGVAAPRDNYVVTTAWLTQHLNDPDLVLLHVGDKAEYDAGHIAGARHVTLREVSLPPDAAGGLTLQLPAADLLRTQLETLGISDNSRVVVYYGKDLVTQTTRVIFTLLAAGLPKVSLLDGGMVEWTKTGGTLTADVPAAKTGKLSALKMRPLIADADFVKTHTATPGFCVIDSRAKEFYEGTMEGGPKDRRKAGHIAGARSVPFTSIVDENNKLKSDAELARLFETAGVKKGDTIITYCHIGQQATTTLFGALLVGYPVMLYDGSFEDWARRDFPVENPAAKR